MKLPPEFLPIIEWWNKSGKGTVIAAAVAVIAVGGYSVYKDHVRELQSEANCALVNAHTAEELEEAVANYSDADCADAIKFKLAKKLYDEESYSAALEVYEGLIGKVPAAVAEIPVMGRAHSLEALGEYDKAIEAYGAFIEKHGEHYLTLDAKLGLARSIALAGDKTAALAKLDETLKSVDAGSADEASVKATIDLVKRYEKRADRIFDAANDAAQTSEEKETK